MEARISIEQYFMYEVVATFNVALEWIKGENRNINQWKKQVGKLKKAFHYFMMEMDVEDFTDVKIPSKNEPKFTKKKKQPKRRKSTKGLLKKVIMGGKQLPILFVKWSKKILLSIVLKFEIMVNYCSNIFEHSEQDFENRVKRK